MVIYIPYTIIRGDRILYITASKPIIAAVGQCVSRIEELPMRPPYSNMNDKQREPGFAAEDVIQFQSTAVLSGAGSSYAPNTS